MSTTTYQVRPSGSRFEGLILIAVTIVMLAGLSLYVEERGRNEEHEVLYGWKARAFST